MKKKNYAISEWCSDSSPHRIELGKYSTKGYSEKHINDIVNNAIKEYYNGDGYTEYPNGNSVNYKNAKFVKFSLEDQTKENELIIGWFSRRNLQNDKFDRVHWGIEKDFRNAILENRRYVVGVMCFDSYEDWYYFAECLISVVKEDGLNINGVKSKLLAISEHTIYKSANLDYSDDKDQGMVNLGLQDKNDKDIYIYGDVIQSEGKFKIHNPRINNKN